MTKPDVTFVQKMTEDYFEVRLPLGVHRMMFAAWLVSDEAQSAFETWAEEKHE